MTMRRHVRADLIPLAIAIGVLACLLVAGGAR